jgi:adenosylcobinamide hydrolase
VDVVEFQIRSRREAGRELPVLLWRLQSPMRTVASSPHGGGLGLRRWVLNAQVPPSYSRRDPDLHLRQLGVSMGLAGRGVGMLTAADVSDYEVAWEEGLSASVTVGLGHPVMAASGDRGRQPLVGTINIVVLLPERLSDPALVNAVATATEAKSQALFELGLRATGTATDAVCILCPDSGRPHSFGGPRSPWGSRLARAVHKAVLSGARGWLR